jgi:citrate lyase subunit beta/citryl-CoA lyase
MTRPPLRSVLYVPGDNERALAKAPTLDVDAIVLDLEDAVAEAAKTEARQRVCRLLGSVDYGHRMRVVRINDPDTARGEEDLAAVLAAAPDAVLLPKLQTGEDLARCLAMIEVLGEAGRNERLQVWAMIETPMALLDLRAIAELATLQPARLAAVVLGSNDLMLATGVRSGPQRANLVPWMMSCVLAAKAYGLAVIDAVHNDFEDRDGLKAECRQARDMGFDGKSLIHPGQIDICNHAFTPGETELRAAQAICDAFALPENAGAGVIVLEGRMLERLHLEEARRLIALAAAIRARGNGP